MGRDKASLPIAGEPLIARTIRLVEAHVASVAIIGKCAQAQILGCKLIDDKDFGLQNETGRPQGPLAGIATALAETRTEWSLILACDLPYLTDEWLAWFLERPKQSSLSGRSHPQVILPRTSGGLEPLAALYRRECGDHIAAALSRGIRKVTDALEQFQIETVPEIEWRRIDPEGLILRNMNTRADYDDARSRLERP